MSLQVNVQLPRRHFTLDLNFKTGRETLGIFGHSGAGKTSLFSLINGLESPSSGSIVLNGKILFDSSRKIHLPPQKRRIGTVFQEKLIFPHMTVKENLLFGVPYCRKAGIALSEVVDLLDLSHILDSPPSEISGGEQQRTAIGRALLTAPELLLMDEPFNAVDSSLRSSILPYLRRLQNELEIPMLVISHDLPDIQRLTDRILILKQGKSVGFGRIDELMDQRELQEDLQGMVNRLEVSSPQECGPGLYSCTARGIGQPIKSPLAPAEHFSLIIPPDEIALSRKPVPSISMQNQISGTLTQIFYGEGNVICLVDCGIPLRVQLTRDALEHLDLHTGDEVCCLFKAHSLKL